MNPMERFRANLKVACQLKIEPETWFSMGLAHYCRHLASYYQVDGHAMVLAIINGVATTCRSTYVNRASHFLVPCNVFNLLVARSGYSKSTILDLAELMAETAAQYFVEFDSKQQLNEQSNKPVSSNESEVDMTTTTTTRNLMPDRTNIQRISRKVVFNDGTAAGVLNYLKSCTCTMHLHEADVTLRSLGLMLPSPSDITPSRIDPFRSTLMTLHEKPGKFIRLLKNERIDISGSKLNIFGASTGDLIAAELVRQAASLAADALFERFIFWPVDGEPIPNEKCITSIDFSQYPSLEQYGVLCGFLGDLILDLEEDGKNILAEQAFGFRVAGSKEDIQDNISARLNKTALVGYRIAGLSGLAEAAFDIVEEYIQQYVTFGEGQADENFFYRAVKLAERKYGPIIRKEDRLVIDTNICKRSHDVTVQNLAQYMALMKIHREDKKFWFGQSSRSMKATMRFTTIEENTETVQLNDMNQHSINNNSKVTLPLTRRQKNMLNKADSYKASILLHPSLIFLKSSLYINSSLKKASSMLESSFLQPLVTDGYLIAIPNGVICRKTKVTVYIKMVPPDDNESKDTFNERLTSFHDQRLNYDTYMASCKTISLHTLGEIAEDVLEVLRLERYQRLNIDFSSLRERVENEYQDDGRDPSSLTSVQENESMNNEDVNAGNDDNGPDGEQQGAMNFEGNEFSNINLFDILSESDGQSLTSATDLLVMNEEVIEQEAEVNKDQTEMMDSESSMKRRKDQVRKEILEEGFIMEEYVHETIAERIRSDQRKRVKRSMK